MFARILLSVFWLALGVCNGYMLLKRVTPFNAQDLKAWSEGLAVSKNYFSAMEFVLLGIGIVAVILWVISMWRRGGQYTGKMHRVAALFGLFCRRTGNGGGGIYAVSVCEEDYRN